MTEQEVADTTYLTFILNKTPQSYDEALNICIYDKRINGVGCVIQNVCPVSLTRYERFPIQDLISFCKAKGNQKIVDFFAGLNINFLTALQGWHDAYSDLSSPIAVRRFKNICTNFNLIYPGDKEI